MLRGLIGLCLGLAVGLVGPALLGLRGRPPAEAPATFSIERWRPGSLLHEVKERVAREGMRLRPNYREGGVVVLGLENGGAGWVNFGFCEDRLVFVRHGITLASTLQAMDYVGRVAGRRREAVVGVEFDPDKTGANSGPRGELTMAWPADGAAMDVKLLNLGSERMLLVETLSAPDQACRP